MKENRKGEGIKTVGNLKAKKKMKNTRLLILNAALKDKKKKNFITSSILF